MSEFLCRTGGYNSGIDPRIKYEVEASRIHTFNRESTGVLWFKKWALSNTFNVSSDTNIIRTQDNGNGNGVVVLQNGDDTKSNFYIYQETDKFLSELRQAGLNIK